MGCIGRGRRNFLVRVAVFLSLAALLLIASPGAAFAQTATQDQYVTQDQYSDSDVQQEPVGPGDPAYPGLTTPVPPSAPPSSPAQSSPAAQDQYSRGGAAGPAPSPVPPAGPSRAPEAAPEDPASSGPASPGPESAGPSQAPVGPGDPAHPGLSSQPPQTFGQTLTDVSAEFGGISQGLAAPSQVAPVTPSQGAAAVPAFSAPTAAVVGGTSPGEPPVAVVDPYSAAVGAASAVGGGAPGYTTWGQPSPGVAVLGGAPQDTQTPVAVMDPYSTAVGAVYPSVPGETAQVAQVLQQMLTLRGLLDAQQPPQQDPFEQQMVATGTAHVDRDEAEWYALLNQAILNPASTGASGPAPPINPMLYGELGCQRATELAVPDSPTAMGDDPMVPTTPGVPDTPGASSIQVTGDQIRACTTPITGLPPYSR